MFPSSYFAPVMFAPSYFPLGGTTPPPPSSAPPPAHLHLSIGLGL